MKKPRRTREMDSRELGTVLAALRHWQKTRDKASSMIAEISTDGKTFDALCNQDIDVLCDQLNYEGKIRIVIPFGKVAEPLPREEPGK